MRRQKGITLIALIITIVVLLILAVVTIGAINDSNIINYAENAATDYEKAKTDENKALEGYLGMIEQSLKTEDSKDVAITADNYGDTIEYSAGGVEEWKVFYKDDSYVYIITSDYLNNTLLPTTLNMNTSGTYCAYWDSEDNFVSAGAIDIEERVASKYMLSWLIDNKSSENNNTRAIADLLNTTVWTAKFGNASKGIEAIGGPTIEMWVASWNAKGYTQLKTEYNNTGYLIGLSTVDSLVDIADQEDETQGGYDIFLGEANGSNDEMYFPYKDYVDNCYGYRLTSTSANSENSICAVDCEKYIFGPRYTQNKMGVRPLVSIPSNLIIRDAEGNLKVAQ